MKNNVSLPQTKIELIEKLHSMYQKLDAELVQISEPKGRIKELEGNISVCDIIAYQIGWGTLLLEWESIEKGGEIPTMPSHGYKWNQLGALAQSFYKKYQNHSLTELRTLFKTLIQQLTAMINSMDKEELFILNQRKWAGPKWPVAKWIQVNTIAPYSSAIKKIKRWKKQNTF